MEDAAIKVTKKGSIYIATCKVSGIETYSKDEIRAIEDCRAKSIERFALWQRELQNSLVLSDMPEDEDYNDEIESYEPGDNPLVRRLNRQTNANSIQIEGMPNVFITDAKEVYEYNEERDEFNKLTVSLKKDKRGFCQYYFLKDNKKYFILKILKDAFGMKV